MAFLLVACDESTETTRSRVAPGQSPATLAVTSGLPEVDQVLLAATSKDFIELAALTGYQTLACGLYDPTAPPCLEGESPGDEVDVLAATACTDGWVRPEKVPAAFRYALEPDTPELVAVYRPAYDASHFGHGPSATVVAVFKTATREDGTSQAVALHLNNGRVVLIEIACPEMSELLTQDRVASWIVEPAEQP